MGSSTLSSQQRSVLEETTAIVRFQLIDENDEPFHWNVVDVYPVRDGKIAKKDTYWKQAK